MGNGLLRIISIYIPYDIIKRSVIPDIHQLIRHISSAGFVDFVHLAVGRSMVDWRE